MPSPRSLEFCSRLRAPPGPVWAHAVSARGVNLELAPFLFMPFPEGRASLDPALTPLGVPLGVIWLRLFGLVPFERWELRLEQLEPGRFVERSRALSLSLWEHERRITPDGDGTELRDRLTFLARPPALTPLVARLVAALFAHRHRRLRETFGARPGVGSAPRPRWSPA